MLRLLVIGSLWGAWVAWGAHAAHAETVALLPLDGEQRLEIYGQPVAREIARALTAGGIDVVVVGAKMAVPDRAQLIVDGTIKAGKGDSVTLAIRIRDPRDGTTLEALAPATATLANLDRAAGELSARVVPAVKTQLAIVTKPNAVEPVQPPTPPGPQPAPALPGVLVAVSMPSDAGEAAGLLRGALDRELPAWARTHRRAAQPIEATKLADNRAAPGSVATGGTDVGIALHVLGLSITPGKVPLARGRVRVRIVDRERVRFDRVVRTDTVVGDREINPDDFAARVAREVLLIVHPNVRRAVPGWK